MSVALPALFRIDSERHIAVSVSLEMPNKPAVIDLFCGAGGLSLGAYRAGFDVVAGFDRDSNALDIHRANFPSCKASTIDIADCSSGALLDHACRKGVEGVIGGPPCQGFSVMGKRDSADPRNTLFRHFFRHVARIGPQFFLAENVPGILSEKARPLVNRSLALVSASYYMIPPFIVNASDYGVPTERKRVFFVGFRRKINATNFMAAINAAKSTEPVLVRDALLGIESPYKSPKSSAFLPWGKVRSTSQPDEFAERLSDRIPRTVGNPLSLEMLRRKGLASGFQVTSHTPDVRKRFAAVKPGEIDQISRATRLDPAAFCPVLRAGTGTENGRYTALRPIHSWEPRVILPREAARMQGFPDWFLLHNTIWHSLRHIGNSVSPIVAEKILQVVRSFL